MGTRGVTPDDARKWKDESKEDEKSRLRRIDDLLGNVNTDEEVDEMRRHLSAVLDSLDDSTSGEQRPALTPFSRLDAGDKLPGGARVVEVDYRRHIVKIVAGGNTAKITKEWWSQANTAEIEQMVLQLRHG